MLSSLITYFHMFSSLSSLVQLVLTLQTVSTSHPGGPVDLTQQLHHILEVLVSWAWTVGCVVTSVGLPTWHTCCCAPSGGGNQVGGNSTPLQQDTGLELWSLSE